MYSDTRKTIEQSRIPRTTVAALAGVASSEVSEYLNGHVVSGQNAVKIEQAVSDVVDLLEFFKSLFDLRPDLKDIEGLKLAIDGLKSAKRSIEMQKELEAANAEIIAGLQHFRN